jgi:phosphatidate cytidylyltransferase
MLFLGGFWFTILISAMAVLGYREFIRLNGFSTTNLQAVIGYMIILYLIFPWDETLPKLEPNFSIVSWLYLLFLLVSTVFSKNRLNIEHIAIYFLAFLYIALGFKYMIDTIWLDHGVFWALLIFSCIWATDSGAYFAGVLLGKRPLLPAISPKKTIEGAIGGLILAVIVGIIYSILNPHLLKVSEATFLAVIISVLGQLGDLIQSAYKRHRNIKDSGRILPGHGGILDRTDSWIIVFPFMHLIFFYPNWLGA